MSNFDVQLFYSINGFAGKNPILDGVGIFLARDLIVFEAFLVFLLMLWMLRGGKEERVRSFFILTIASVAISFALSYSFGFVRFRSRPFVSQRGTVRLVSSPSIMKSFPSGHATVAFALAFATALALPAWAIPMLALALLVGVGRVFVGVHYPLDVFGGGLLALVVTLCIRYLQLKNKNGHTLHSRE